MASLNDDSSDSNLSQNFVPSDWEENVNKPYEDNFVTDICGSKTNVVNKIINRQVSNLTLISSLWYSLRIFQLAVWKVCQKS